MNDEPIYRKVIKYERWERQRGRHSQRETLSCGHILRNKGSVGEAAKRKCKDCERLRDGCIVTWPSLGVSEVWNPDTEMPIKILTPDGI